MSIGRWRSLSESAVATATATAVWIRRTAGQASRESQNFRNFGGANRKFFPVFRDIMYFAAVSHRSYPLRLVA
jgi:hypothetical protein